MFYPYFSFFISFSLYIIYISLCFSFLSIILILCFFSFFNSFPSKVRRSKLISTFVFPHHGPCITVLLLRRQSHSSRGCHKRIESRRASLRFSCTDMGEIQRRLRLNRILNVDFFFIYISPFPSGVLASLVRFDMYFFLSFLVLSVLTLWAVKTSVLFAL